MTWSDDLIPITAIYDNVAVFNYLWCVAMPN